VEANSDALDLGAKQIEERGAIERKVKTPNYIVPGVKIPEIGVSTIKIDVDRKM